MQPPEDSNGHPPVPPVLSAHREPVNRWRWWVHLLLIGGYLGAVAVLSATQGAAREPALTHTVLGLLAVCAIQLGIFGWVFVLAWLASRASSDELLLRWRPGLAVVPLSIGYSVALRLAVGLVWVLFCVGLLLSRVVSLADLQAFARAHRPQVNVLVDLAALRNNPIYFWLTVTLVSFVVAGLREELWRSAFLAGLRHLWPSRFGSRRGQVGAVAVAAVIFGLGHLAQGVVAVGMAAVLGFGLGLIMVWHRSIWPAVLAHGLFDATTFGLLPWAMEKLQQFH